MEIQYIGEHLLPGILGKISVYTAFVSAIALTVAYFISAQTTNIEEAASWKRVARGAFYVHAAGVMGIVAALFYIIQGHLFEYHYAWQHSSLELPPKYLLACFWEGQEGSFLLWMFWHVILGVVLLFTSKKWEAPVMAVVGITQVFLASMLLGFAFGEIKIGSNPFNLLREVMEAPIFSRADYLSFVKDGTGLNPLLQNYWMVIHPPVLFLGFASTLVPFAYTIASLWKNDFIGWVKPVLPWTLFSGMILGTGILMGGAWAYESLTFGGFWAWDPVENASLVPWITLIGGLHTLVVYKSTGHALKATYILFISTFVLILYSTFLTRSGILGDASVHSFTDLGMSGQLVMFMAFFVALSIFLIAFFWKKIPSPQKEEEVSSREFWMFIGALIFFISAFQITFSTSTPVWNKFFPLLSNLPFLGMLFEKELAPPVNAELHYNSLQIWFGVMIGTLSGFIQYLRYKKTEKGFFNSVKWLLLASFVIAALLSSLLDIPQREEFALRVRELFSPTGKMPNNIAWLSVMTGSVFLLFSTVFAVIANGAYIITALKGKIKSSGASVAHIGFALLLLGTLISQYNQRVISINKSGVDFGESFDSQAKMENILLRKNVPVMMAEYEVAYVGDSISGPNNFYKVSYRKLDKAGNAKETFYLYPNAQINPNMGLVSNPDTRHYLTKDIYTHVTSVPDKERIAQSALEYERDTVAVGDTFFTAKAYVIVEGVVPNPPLKDLTYEENDLAVGVKLRAYTLDDTDYTAMPVYLIRNNTSQMLKDSIVETGTVFRLEKVLPEQQKLIIGFLDKDPESEFIIMKAIVFPYINVLWLGCFIMVIGFIIGIYRRAQENRRELRKQE